MPHLQIIKTYHYFFKEYSDVPTHKITKGPIGDRVNDCMKWNPEKEEEEVCKCQVEHQDTSWMPVNPTIPIEYHNQETIGHTAPDDNHGVNTRYDEHFQFVLLGKVCVCARIKVTGFVLSAVRLMYCHIGSLSVGIKTRTFSIPGHGR